MPDIVSSSGAQPDDAPRPVSRGARIQLGFLGLDSLYLVLEYPFKDVFEHWSSVVVKDDQNKRLYAGIPYEDFLIRNGGLGYRLSIWQGDARLFITDRVEENLRSTGSSGEGMGVMLQLGPQWLRLYGDVVSPERLIANVFAQLTVFGIRNPEQYKARLNRIDLTVDLIGVDVADFSVDEWRKQWVGYTGKKDFHDAPITGKLQGLSIGSSSGTVRFKVYDKVAEARKSGTSGFWHSVWGITADDDLPVARFEWTIKAYQAKFVNLRYLTDFTFERFLDLLNYASLRWGRLCLPNPDDTNKSRWALAPLWLELRRFIDHWTLNYDGMATRKYEFHPDLKPAYLKSVAGWIAGLMARVGIDYDLDSPATLSDAIDLLLAEGQSVNKKSKEKWDIFSRLLQQDDASDE